MIISARVAFLFVAYLSLSACVTQSKVYEVAPDTYTVSGTGDGFSSATRVIDSAMKSAHDYCEKKHQRFLLVNQQQGATRMDIDTTVTVTFQCQ